MPEVYNWQLGRMMTYVYEEKHPKEQFTFVFNTNRCILVRLARCPISQLGLSLKAKSTCGGTM